MPSGFIEGLRSERFDLLAQSPDEAGEFTRDRDDDLVAIQAARREPAVARTQTQLRFPGKIGDGLWQSEPDPSDAGGW